MVFAADGARHIPRQQFFNPIDRMVGDAFDDVAQVGFGVETVEFRGTDQGCLGSFRIACCTDVVNSTRSGSPRGATSQRAMAVQPAIIVIGDASLDLLGCVTGLLVWAFVR